MSRRKRKEKKTVSTPKVDIKPQSKTNIKLYLLGAIPFFILVFFSGYYFGYNSALNEQSFLAKQKIVEDKKATKDLISENKKRLEVLQEIELVEIVEKVAVIKKTTEVEDTSINSKLKEILHNEVKAYTSASHEFDDKVNIPPKSIERKIQIVESKSKPKLAIIIDDVCTKSQIKVIKNLGIPITMSFLPPSKARPNSAKLAFKEDFYMVHLPMEAQHFTAEEPLTLRVKDSQKKISSRITELKKLFPRVKYINNHTGSKFTSDEIAMNKLILSLNKNKINFIDSRTTAKTKAPKVLKKFGKKYIARDIFLDNKNEKQYIVEQIKKAIKIAKKYGSAIAIGHPHSKTMLALLDSKELFKDVKLVLIDKIY